MSQAITSIYNILASDPELDKELARSIHDTTLMQPGIYENWPGENAAIPYIILEWSFPQGGGHWAKVNASLSIHIFVENMDSLKIDRIRDRITFLLDWEYIQQQKGGLIRVYKGPNDTPVGNESPDVIHWLIDFDVVYYRNNFAMSK